MAYDAETFTLPAAPQLGAAPPTLAELRALPAAKARALYDLAAAVRVPLVWEIAAHATAGALERAVVDLEALRLELATLRANPPAAEPSGPISPAPAVETTAKPKRQSAPKAPAGPDLAAPLAMPPKAKRAAGAFHCVWDDGSDTRVTGVVYHVGKPETRWAAAFQAADRLRRLRTRNAYADSFAPNGEVSGRWVKGPLGVMVESADWWALNAARPMPALAAIYDETAGEMFEVAAGARFGAGDPERARILEAAMVTPVRPFDPHAWRNLGGDFAGLWEGAFHKPGDDHRPDGFHVLPGAPRDADWRRTLVADARAAFEPETPYGPPALATALAGAPVGEADPFDLDGAAVTVSRDTLAAMVDRLDGAYRSASADLEAANKACEAAKAAAHKPDAPPEAAEAYARALDAVRAGAKARERALQLANHGKPALAMLRRAAGLRLTFNRTAGGRGFRLTRSDGQAAHFPVQLLEALAYAA